MTVKIEELKKIRNYFLEHDKTTFEHHAHNFLNDLIDSLEISNRFEQQVNAKITETKYKPATPFTISADSEYDIIYNLRERKNRRIHQPIYEKDIIISINHRHLPLEQKREIARVIEKALNSNFSL